MAHRTLSSEQARTAWRKLLDPVSQGGVDIVAVQDVTWRCALRSNRACALS
jgi:hypothetical protein